jgi:hypothetical protein
MPTEGINKGQNSLETLRKEIRERIEKVRHNPISQKRLQELESRMDAIFTRFSEKGERTTGEIKEEKNIISEISRHSVVVYGIAEFRLVLEEMADYIKGFYTKEDIDDILAHENAHMNVASSLEYKISGYALTFIDSGDGNLGVQPSCLFFMNENWNLKQTLNNTISSLDAPRKYGNSLSEKDINGIIFIRRILQKLHNKEMG